MNPVARLGHVARSSGEAGEARALSGRLTRAALQVWTAIGVGVLVVAIWLLAHRLAVVVVPLLLALFPAALLAPVVDRLARHRVPRPVAVAAVLGGSAALGAGVVALLVPAFVSQLPELTRSLDQAATRLGELLHRLPFVTADTTLGDLARRAAGVVGTGLDAVVRMGLDLFTGLVLLLVVLALYLAGGRRIVSTGVAVLPRRHRADVRELCDLVWQTLTSYSRALVLVALVDSAGVGLGLWLLGVPLALPLAVLVFLGAFVPYVGAFVSGLLAVLVALADGGIGVALAVLALIVAVQQLEGNVVHPLVMGRAVRLSAFTVIVAIGVGATLLGVLGALIAVPAAACTARVVTFLRERGATAPDDGRG